MVAEALLRDELLDRRLLVREQVRGGEGAAAQRAEVLRRADAAAHDHEVRGLAGGDQLRGGLDELRPALLAADEAGEADGDAILREAERLLRARRRDGRAHRVVDDRER